MRARLKRLNNYTAYSVGCAAVGAVILLVFQRVGHAETRKTMQLGCAAWLSGWASATTARAGSPPPEKLGPGAKALQVTSIPLVAFGPGNAIHFIWAGRKHRGADAAAPDGATAVM
jgi:hypothetical protein